MKQFVSAQLALGKIGERLIIGRAIAKGDDQFVNRRALIIISYAAMIITDVGANCALYVSIKRAL